MRNLKTLLILSAHLGAAACCALTYPLNGNGSAIEAEAPALKLPQSGFVGHGNGGAFQLPGTTLLTALNAAEAAAIPSGEFSVSFLYKPGANGNYQVLLAQAATNPGDRLWWIAYSPLQRRLDFLVREDDNTAQAQVFSEAIINSGEWALIVATCSGNSLALSATPLSAAAPSPIVSRTPITKPRVGSSPLTIGGRRGDITAALASGIIDELVFWDHALSLPEIDGLFQWVKAGNSLDDDFNLAEAALASELEERESSLPFFAPNEAESFALQAPVHLQAVGDKAGMVLPVQLASGDFRAEFTLNVVDLRATDFQIWLGPDGFAFDGASHRLTNTGNEGINAFKNRPLNYDCSGQLNNGEPFKFTLQQTDQVFTLALNGREIYRGTLDRDTYGEVAILALRGALTVESASLHGALLPNTSVPVFQAGENETPFYRIPALVLAQDGCLLIFAEARRKDHHDLGNINMVLRRSHDKGQTWEPIQVLMGEECSDTYGNPCPVVDPVTGRIHLMFQRVNPTLWSRGEYQLLYTWSDDHGATWAAPVDVRSQVPAAWLNFHPGPGHGVILKNGEHKGRILIPGWYVYRDHADQRHYASALIYSDDNGANWQAGGIAMDGSDECLLAELEDGSLLMAIRPPLGIADSEYRHFAVSHDGGQSFEPYSVDNALRATVCQVSILTAPDEQDIFLCYPASGNYAPNAALRRAGLTLRSKQGIDGTWSEPLLLYAGRSAYSDIVKIDENTLGIVFEGGRKTCVGDIRFMTVDTAALPPSQPPAGE